MPPVITADRFQVTLSSTPGVTWRTSAGAGGERDIAKRRRTPGGKQENIIGRATLNDVTLTIGYDRDTEKLALRALKGDLFAGTITRQALDLDDTPIPGQQVIFTDCVLKSYSIPDSDVDSGDPADLTFVMSIGATA
jgi:hypothetical protein